MDKKLYEQRMNREWGGHLEIAALSELYNTCITMCLLSLSGELIARSTPHVETQSRKCLWLVRDCKIHYNPTKPRVCVIANNKRLLNKAHGAGSLGALS